MAVTRKLIKYLLVLFLATNVFAGGDDRDEQANIEEEIAAFEAQLEAELAAQDMMAEIMTEEERAKRLAEFQAKLEADKAAAAKSTAIYQARKQQEQIIKDNQARLAQEAIEREIAEFEAEFEAEYAAQQAKLEAEKFEAEYAAQQAKLEAEKFEADYAAQQAKLEAEKFEADYAAQQAKLAEEKAAAAAAAAEAAELAAFKAELARYEECKSVLDLSDSNIALFKSALVDGSLFSVGPQITSGTEFTANRWDDYASCIGALGYKNPF